MAANTYTTTDLVSDVQLLGHVPLGNNTFTAPTILRLASFEMLTPIAKQILSTRGGYYLTYIDYDTAADGLYDVPPDAVAGGLVNVELIQGTTIIPVSIIEESEQYSTIAPTSTSYGAFLRGNLVQILPMPNVGNARLWYIKRMSNLVTTSACAQVVSVAGAVISVSSVPSTIVNGSLIDVCGDQPPFNVLGEREIIDITGTDITLDLEVEDVEAGDWICLHSQTCVPQIPVEFRLLLAQRVVVKIYELQGYLDKMRAAQEKLKEYEDQTFMLITPRVQAKTKVISPVDGGFLKGNPNRSTNFPAGRE